MFKGHHGQKNVISLRLENGDKTCKIMSIYLEPLNHPAGVCQSDAATEWSSGGIFSVNNLVPFLLGHRILIHGFGVPSVAVIIIIAT